METQFERLSTEALTLSLNERAVLAQLLLASLDEDAEIEDAWAIEAERRLLELESGSTQAIPMAEALAMVRAKLK